AATLYTGVMPNLITRFKFQDKHEPLPLFLRLLHAAGRDLFPGTDVLVPVPLHPLRLLQRRFNQSALLAKGLGRVTGIKPLLSVLKRIRRTKAQVGLDRMARELNVKAAFGLAKNGRKLLTGKNVLLIDDVMTTGATANACALALSKGGAARV